MSLLFSVVHLVSVLQHEAGSHHASLFETSRSDLHPMWHHKWRKSGGGGSGGKSSHQYFQPITVVVFELHKRCCWTLNTKCLVKLNNLWCENCSCTSQTYSGHKHTKYSLNQWPSLCADESTLSRLRRKCQLYQSWCQSWRELQVKPDPKHKHTGSVCGRICRSH